MRRWALVACAMLLLAQPAVAGTGGTAPGSAARLQGTWKMSAKVTRANGVRGEHKGQRFTRSWTFTSSCASGACSKVSLRRERSRKQFDKVTLKRSGSVYAGSGKFYLRLKCNGKTYKRGGIAYYTIKLSATKSKVVQTGRFATAVKASYNNTRRVNKTPCGGSLGRDAGSYSGKHAAPTAPTAAYAFSDDSMEAGTLDFTDQSTAMKGAKLVSWNWDFGDRTTSTKRNPKHHYSAVPGTYDVTLTVKDSNGLTSSVKKTVPVT